MGAAGGGGEAERLAGSDVVRRSLRCGGQASDAGGGAEGAGGAGRGGGGKKLGAANLALSPEPWDTSRHSDFVLMCLLFCFIVLIYLFVLICLVVGLFEAMLYQTGSLENIRRYSVFTTNRTTAKADWEAKKEMMELW